MWDFIAGMGIGIFIGLLVAIFGIGFVLLIFYCLGRLMGGD